MRDKHLLIFSQYFFPESFRINSLLVKLQPEFASSTVITGKPNYPYSRLFTVNHRYFPTCDHFIGSRIIRLPEAPRIENNHIQLLINYISMFISYAVFTPFCKEIYRADVVLLYALSPMYSLFPALIWSKLFNKRVVLWLQDLWPESIEHTLEFSLPLVDRLLKRFSQIMYSHCDQLILQSPSFTSHLPSFAFTKSTVIYNSVDNSILDSDHSEVASPFIRNVVDNLKYQHNLDRIIVAYTGNIGHSFPLKSFITAVKYLNQYSHYVTFLFAGTGSCAHNLITQISHLNLDNNFIFTGQLKSFEVDYILQFVDYGLVALKNKPGFNLTIPTKLQHYCSASLPIFCLASGVSEEIVITHNIGISVPPDDPFHIAKALSSIPRSSSSSYMKMSQNSIKVYNNLFSYDVTLPMILKVLSATS